MEKDNNNNNITFKIYDEKEMKEILTKYSILKSALIAEKEQTKNQRSKIESLEMSLSEKNQIISHLRSEIESLNNTITDLNKGYQDPQFLPTNSPKENSNSTHSPSISSPSPPEIDSLKNENVILKIQLESFESQCDAFKQALENMTEEFDKFRTKAEKEKEELGAKIAALENSVKSKEKIIDEFRAKEGAFENFKEENRFLVKNLREDKRKLEENEKKLKDDLNIYTDALLKFKTEIEKMNNYNINLELKIDKLKPIDKSSYHFFGTILDGVSSECMRKKVEIFFGSYEDVVIFKVNFEAREVKINDICYMRKYGNKSNLIEIEYYFSYKKLSKMKRKKKEEGINDSHTKIIGEDIKDLSNIEDEDDELEDKDDDDLDIQKMICQFTERECQFIIKFYKELKKNQKEREDEIMMLTGNFLY